MNVGVECYLEAELRYGNHARAKKLRLRRFGNGISGRRQGVTNSLFERTSKIDCGVDNIAGEGGGRQRKAPRVWHDIFYHLLGKRWEAIIQQQTDWEKIPECQLAEVMHELDYFEDSGAASKVWGEIAKFDTIYFKVEHVDVKSVFWQVAVNIKIGLLCLSPQALFWPPLRFIG